MSDPVEMLARALWCSREDMEKLSKLSDDATKLVRLLALARMPPLNDRRLLQCVVHSCSALLIDRSMAYLAAREQEPDGVHMDDAMRAKVFIRTLGDLIVRMAIDEIDDTLELNPRRTP